MDAETRTAIQFDGWKLMRDPLELFHEQSRVKIQEQPLMILESLLEKPGILVRREDLIAKLWPRTVTDYDAGLHTAVRKLRAVLADDPDAPRYIETVPRKGYRFIASLSPTVVEPAPAIASPGPQSRRTGLWMGAALVALILAAGWKLLRPVTPPSAADPAHELWLSGVLAWQTVGGGGTTLAEINRVEDLFTRAIELDPSLAVAYADRSRVRAAKFGLGSDTSDSNIAAAKADLAKARQLAGPRAFVLVGEARFAYLVDGDMDRALALLRQAEAIEPLDGDELMTKANFTAFAGRQEESLGIYERAVRLDPGNAVIYRFWMVNLFAAHRPVEALRVVKQVDTRMPGRIERGEWLFSYTGDTRRWRTEVEAGNRFGKLTTGLSNEFDLLRMEGNRQALRELVAGPEPGLFRPHSAARTLIGAIDRPLAELRGWERLLSGDAAGAAAAGRELDSFLARQTVQPWNEWSIRLLEAEAATMRAECPRAIERSRVALDALPKYPNFAIHIYPRMLAARVLAWCRAHDESLGILEALATHFPGVGPASISRDPLLQQPLSGHPRWMSLRDRLEAQVRGYADLGS